MFCWASSLPPIPIHASYQEGVWPIMGLRPLELIHFYQWVLGTVFASCFAVDAEFNEVALVAVDTLECRFNLLPDIVQYHLYCDRSYAPPVTATTRSPEMTQKAGCAFVISANYTPRKQDEAIEGPVAGPSG